MSGKNLPNIDSHHSSVNPEEIRKFSEISSAWWDEKGPFKPLHAFNETRIHYIRKTACHHFNREDNRRLPFQGLKILDIGCGGGILSEPLARLGGAVTAIDPSIENITEALSHAKHMGLMIDYRAVEVETLARAKEEYFDMVLCMEVVEHVADLELFIHSAVKLIAPGGMMYVATLNRTVKSFLHAIIGAEYVLRWLPKHTHDWKKFPKPSEIHNLFLKNSMQLVDLKGFNYNFSRKNWSLSDRCDVNYIMQARPSV